MESIRIQNLRSLKDTGEIKIKPITILVGGNSSGKSTFLRTFPMFKQSFMHDTLGTLSLYGDIIDFGEFNESLSRFAENEEISFEIKFSNKYNNFIHNLKYNRITRHQPLREKLEELFSGNKENNYFLKFDIISKGEITSTKEFEIHINDQKIKGQFNQNNLAKLKINGQDFSSRCNNFKFQKIGKIFPLARINYDDDLKSCDCSNTTSSINETLFSIITEIFEFFNNFFEASANSVEYTAPLRATAERYYRLQDFPIDKIDMRGRNVPSFIKGLSDKEAEKFRKWTLETFSFCIAAEIIKGHTSLVMYNKENEVLDDEIKGINIADKGFGFSQILPIICQLWILNFQNKRSRNLRYFTRPNIRETIYTIEQPELHLHPKLQSKLVEVIANTVKKGKVKFIIETHSPSIINAFGDIIYEENKEEYNKNSNSTKIKLKDNINVVLFSKESENHPSDIMTTEFDEEGALKEWPYGFFNHK